MATKKKSKPRFEVPEEIDSKAQSGWVYRSTAEAAPPAPPPVVEVKRGDGKAKSEPAAAPAAAAKSESASSAASDLFDASAKAIAYSFAAAGNAVLLATRVMILPWTLTVRLFRGK